MSSAIVCEGIAPLSLPRKSNIASLKNGGKKKFARKFAGPAATFSFSDQIWNHPACAMRRTSKIEGRYHPFASIVRGVTFAKRYKVLHKFVEYVCVKICNV